jgi:hypothetical protein
MSESYDDEIQYFITHHRKVRWRTRKETGMTPQAGNRRNCGVKNPIPQRFKDCISLMTHGRYWSDSDARDCGLESNAENSALARM